MLPSRKTALALLILELSVTQQGLFATLFLLFLFQLVELGATLEGKNRKKLTKTGTVISQCQMELSPRV